MYKATELQKYNIQKSAILMDKGADFLSVYDYENAVGVLREAFVLLQETVSEVTDYTMSAYSFYHWPMVYREEDVREASDKVYSFSSRLVVIDAWQENIMSLLGKRLYHTATRICLYHAKEKISEEDVLNRQYQRYLYKAVSILQKMRHTGYNKKQYRKVEKYIKRAAIIKKRK